MLTLGQIVNSEYDLMGAVNEDELLGALDRASTVERKSFLKRIKGGKGGSAAASGARPDQGRRALVAAGALELIRVLREQHVEAGQRSVLGQQNEVVAAVSDAHGCQRVLAFCFPLSAKRYL